jgi:hypothetical protein
MAETVAHVVLSALTEYSQCIIQIPEFLYYALGSELMLGHLMLIL